MFKDPYDDTETPYELLDVAPDTPMSSVQSALPRFMRNPRNMRRVGLAQDAIKRLKAPMKRAIVDIFLYDIDHGATAIEPVADDDLSWLDEFAQVPLFQLSELLQAFVAIAAQVETPSIECRDVEIAEPDMSATLAVSFPIQFDY